VDHQMNLFLEKGPEKISPIIQFAPEWSAGHSKALIESQRKQSSVQPFMSAAWIAFWETKLMTDLKWHWDPSNRRARRVG
jgi:hypothetical protein